MKHIIANPGHIFLVTEHIPGNMIRFAYSSHVVRLARVCETDDSFVYHNVGEAFECQRYEKGRPLCPREELELAQRLSLRDGHFWLNAVAKIGMYWL